MARLLQEKRQRRKVLFDQDLPRQPSESLTRPETASFQTGQLAMLLRMLEVESSIARTSDQRVVLQKGLPFWPMLLVLLISEGRTETEFASALNNLSIEDEDATTSYTKPTPDALAYESSLASACGVSLNTRILAFKPAPPESSKPIDLRSQYNRPLKKANATSAQFRRKVLSAPERVLDAPGLVDDYYLNLLDWSSGNQVAIGLERNVYVWSAEAGTVNCLFGDES